MSLVIADAFIAAIAANATLGPLIGENIWATMAPVGTDPDSGVPTGVAADGLWVVFHRVSNPGESAHDGDAAIRRPRYQFDICSTDKEAVDAARDVFEQEFNGFEFVYTNEDNETYRLTFFHEDDTDDFEEFNNRIYKSIHDKIIWVETNPE